MQSFKTLLDFLNYFKNEEVCKTYLENIIYKNGVVCPFCNNTENIYKYTTREIFKCSECSKQFSITVGTIFEKSQIPLQKWFLAIYLNSTLEKGISSVNLSKQIGVTQKTAWFMLHRIRYAIENKTFLKPLEGTFEIDETFVGGKNKNRHADKKVKNSQGRSFKDKTPVLGIYNNETTEVKSIVVKDTQATTIKPILYENIEFGSNITTDEWKAYRGLTTNYFHSIVNHSKKEYQNDLGLTTNHIENHWTRVKRSIMGTYHYTSKKHLQLYCNEFDFKHNNRLNSNAFKFNEILANTYNKRLEYKLLIN